jgi:hypothetical protein
MLRLLNYLMPVIAIVCSGCFDDAEGSSQGSDGSAPSEHFVSWSEGAPADVTAYKTLGGAHRVLISLNGHYCAEPPPDAASALAQGFGAQLALEGSVGLPSGPSIEGGGSGELERSRIESLVKLFERSQGIQALRDGMYRLCEARANNFINDDVFRQQMNQLVATLNFVVPIELCTKMFVDSRLEASGAQMAGCIKSAFDFGSRLVSLDIQRDQYALERAKFEEYQRIREEGGADASPNAEVPDGDAGSTDTSDRQ